MVKTSVFYFVRFLLKPAFLQFIINFLKINKTRQPKLAFEILSWQTKVAISSKKLMKITWTRVSFRCLYFNELAKDNKVNISIFLKNASFVSLEDQMLCFRSQLDTYSRWHLFTKHKNSIQIFYCQFMFRYMDFSGIEFYSSPAKNQ